MALDLGSLRKGVASLEEALQVAGAGKFPGFSEAEKRVVKAGVIQNFEFTYELCWKYMRRWLEVNIGRAYGEGVPRRELFRMARENQLIADVDAWMGYHQARNDTSHTYNSAKADEIFEVSGKFLADAGKFMEELEKRNA
ncbi:MAG: nucleotidyltransferase substrate binding protein [Elusimicrobia bacterium]|nr:nucleotidyltransferase substrate binding protein [Elusimicrobiota bacterium]